MKNSDKLKTLRTKLLDHWVDASRDERLNILVKIMDLEEELGISITSQNRKKANFPRKARAI